MPISPIKNGYRDKASIYTYTDAFPHIFASRLLGNRGPNPIAWSSVPQHCEWLPRLGQTTELVYTCHIKINHFPHLHLTQSADQTRHSSNLIFTLFIHPMCDLPLNLKSLTSGLSISTPPIFPHPFFSRAWTITALSPLLNHPIT